MFSFINSLVLPLLAAAVIPLLIYLFQRRKTKHIQFSSLRFLKILENQRIRNLRIYQILLLLIRMAFIVFLVLAFARPALRTLNITGSSAASTTAVIIIDDSYSMKAFSGAKTRFELALEALNKILTSLDDEDQFYILSTQDAGTKINSQSESANLSAGNHILPLDKLLNEAVKIFKEHPNLNKELYLLTDGMINHYSLSDTLPPYLTNKGIRSLIVRTSTENLFVNVSIDTVIMLTRLFEVNQPVTFEVHMTNHDQRAPSSIHLNLYNANKRMAMAQGILSPGASGTLQIRYSPRNSGRQMIHFELDDDDLPIDNYYYKTFMIPEQLKILFVDQPGQGLLKTAIQTVSGGTALKIENTNYTSWQGRQFMAYDLIVLNDPPAVNIQTSNRLAEYFRQGKNLILIPGEDMTPTELNSMFKNWIGRDIVGELIKSSTATQYFSLEKQFYQNNLFQSVFSHQNRKIEIPKIYKYFKLIPSDNNIISLDDNSPFLARYQRDQGQGKLYLFAAKLEPDWTDFPFQGFFIPMLYRILYEAGYTINQLSSYIIGQEARLSPSTISAEIDYEMKAPNNDRYPLSLTATAAGPQLLPGKIREPGSYLLYADQQIESAFSANLSSSELKQPFVDLSAVFPDANILSPEDISSENLIKARIGQELWLLFLMLAIIMLILEIWLIKIIEKGGRS